jgi:membrane protein DedA with SNARE-associated domain
MRDTCPDFQLPPEGMLGAFWPDWLPGALFFGTFFSEDLTCLTAGGLVASGGIDLLQATLACGLGIFASDLGLYGLGWMLARGAVRWPWLRKRMPAPDGRASRAFQRHAVGMLFASRFLPGSRLPLYLAAGACGYSLWRFSAILLVAAALWTPAIIAVAAASGSAAQQVVGDLGRWSWVAMLAGLLLVWLALHTLPLFATRSGRQGLAARWTRLVQWEYWPTWLVYPPVVLTLCIEAIRARTLLPFTACNPGIPMGGLAMESKGDILDQMPQGEDLPVAVAPYARLCRERPLEERVIEVAQWLLGGAVVLKPDQGERGQGVAVVRDIEHARKWLAQCPLDGILQRYVGGAEFGVVWRRLPAGGSEVRSVARKVPPSLRGDGQRSLRELILADERAAPMAAVHFARHAASLTTVPAAGTLVVLGELGTHCRGATFYDARNLCTPELQQALEQFLSGSPGLDFGRFDLRVANDESLRRGQGISILEFNGVTGEPAHMYQPGYPWWRGIRDLCAHWQAACANGRANHARGHRPARLREVLRLLAQLRRRPNFEAPTPDPSGPSG